MMKRVFWLGVGVVAGASGTVWAERKVKERLEALSPDNMAVAAGNRALAAGRSVIDAVADGRDAMRSREEELRGEYRRGTGDSVATHSAPTRGSARTPATRHRR